MIPSVQLSLFLALVPTALPGDGDPPARALLLELTGEARLAGTSGSLRAARMVARELEAAGFEVEVDERDVLLSLPRRLELALHADNVTDAPFHERIEHFDPDAIPAGDVPPFNAWSANGEVRGAIVDAGYGARADFERLKAARIDLGGKLALCRYGKGYRGVKVDLATQYGCAGVLLYSHPDDDGAAKGDTWPAGPWKPDWDAQRGSISPMGRTPGDPSTPGFASPAPGAELAEGRARITGEELAEALPTIPCMPITAAEAQLVVERLATKRLPDEEGVKRGVKVGPGPVEARLLVDAPREIRTIRNVLGRLRGEREGTVIAGNHRDAWVRGAHDAGGGTVAVLRAAQHLGERVRGGWKPLNTITVAFWDGEEQGLIGSTEWAEANAEWLQRNALLYVNADAAVSGTQFGASGTPGSKAILAYALRQIERPAGLAEGNTTNLWEQWRKSSEGEPRLGLPGSGSDFAVFLHHLSLPVLDIGFRGNKGGQYHTAFDDFLVVERHLDPGFVGHELAGRFLAQLLADVSTFGRFSFDDAEAALEMARHAREAGDWLGEGSQRLAAALESLAEAARLEELERALDLVSPLPKLRELQGQVTEAALAKRTSEKPVGRFYHALETTAGLHGRTWFKNRLWTPGLELGYGAETFPTLRAAAARSEAELAAELADLIDAIEGLRTAWERGREE